MLPQPTGTSPQPKANRPQVIVSGCPRSGTSLLLRILSESGVPVVADERRSWECDRVLRLEFENEWVRELPLGSAMKVLFPMVLHLPQATANWPLPHIIWMSRNPREQAKSQRAMAGFRRGDIHPRSKVLAQLNRKIPDLLRRRGGPVLVLPFDDLVGARAKAQRRLEAFLGIPLDMGSVVSRDSRYSGLPVGTLETPHPQAIGTSSLGRGTG